MTPMTTYLPFLSLLTLPNPLVYPIALKLSPLQHTFSLNLINFIYPQPLQLLHAINVFAMAIIGRTALNTGVPTVMSPSQVTQLATVSSSNMTSVGIGIMEPVSVPITTVWFVLNQGISWVIVLLNAYPYHNHPLSMKHLLSPPSNYSSEESLVIKPGAQLYRRGNVMVFLLFCHILLILFNTSCYYWRGVHPSNNSYLVVTGPTSFFLSHL